MVILMDNNLVYMVVAVKLWTNYIKLQTVL